MQKLDKPDVPIDSVAQTLGFTIKGNCACCFNGAGHHGGKDTNPSLVFLTKVNRFQCYSCGVNGDVIDLVKSIQGCSYAEALRWLKSSFPVGSRTVNSNPIAITGAGTRMPTEKDQQIYQRLYEITAAPESDSPGGEYLRYERKIKLKVVSQCHVREILDAESIWEELQQEFSTDELESAGLLSKNGNFLFQRHPLLFFYLAKGIPQYVMARSITDSVECKELALNGIKAPIPYLSDNLLDSPSEVVLTEGHLDALSAIQFGYRAVGIPGVTRFNHDWFRLFGNTRHVTIVFDNDDAGRNAAAELRSQFRMRGIKADTMFPANHKDLNDLLKHIP